MGKGNTFGPFCYIGPGVSIGDDNLFAGYVSVGMAAEHRDYFRKLGTVVIGSRNVIREFVTINSSTLHVTRMGDDCTMLRGSHLSHDSILEDNVTVSCNVLIGGESHVMKGSNLGLGCIIHQRQVIGSFSMIGMGAVIPKGLQIEPGGVWVGSPARFLKPNTVGLVRAGIDEGSLTDEQCKFKVIREKLHAR